MRLVRCRSFFDLLGGYLRCHQPLKQRLTTGATLAAPLQLFAVGLWLRSFWIGKTIAFYAYFGLSWSSLGLFWRLLGLFESICGFPLALLWLSWGSPGPHLVSIGRFLGFSWTALGPPSVGLWGRGGKTANKWPKTAPGVV